MKGKVFLTVFAIAFLSIVLIIKTGGKEISFEVSNLDGGKLILRKYKWGYPVKVDFRFKKGNYTLIAVETKIPELQEKYGYPLIAPLNDSSTIYLLLLPPSLLKKDLFQGKDSLDLLLSFYLKEEKYGKESYLKLSKKITIYRR